MSACGAAHRARLFGVAMLRCIGAATSGGRRGCQVRAGRGGARCQRQVWRLAVGQRALSRLCGIVADKQVLAGRRALVCFPAPKPGVALTCAACLDNAVLLYELSAIPNSASLFVVCRPEVDVAESRPGRAMTRSHCRMAVAALCCFAICMWRLVRCASHWHGFCLTLMSMWKYLVLVHFCV